MCSYFEGCRVCSLLCVFVFFKQKTAYEMRISDWSSDVCSSDLFFVNFGMVLGVLLGIAFVCVVAARLLDSGDEHQEPQAQARLEERIKPVANVVTDPSVLVKLAAAEQASRPAMTGEQV